MKKLLLILLLPMIGFGQDKIILFNQEPNEILCKVLEINENNIRFKKFSNITGPTYSYPKSEVYMIKYSNGTSETITEKFDDDPINLFIWLNRGEVKPKKDTRSTKEIIASMPDCLKKKQKDTREDAMALIKLWQWGYIDLPREDINPSFIATTENVKALLEYQKKYSLRELKIDIVSGSKTPKEELMKVLGSGCRISQETLKHINDNEQEVIVNELTNPVKKNAKKKMEEETNRLIEYLGQDVNRKITRKMMTNGYTGKGTYSTDFYIYVGEIKNGKKHGQGVETWGTGSRYVGEWKDNKHHGQGTQYTSTATVFGTGLWVNGKLVESKTPVKNMNIQENDLNKEITQEMMTNGYTGKGTYTIPNIFNYVGEFKNGKWHGQGTATWIDSWFGMVYIGEWKDGEENGQGTCTYSDGRKYVGEFKDGYKNGQGTCTYSDGTVEKGLWIDGEYLIKSK